MRGAENVSAARQPHLAQPAVALPGEAEAGAAFCPELAELIQPGAAQTGRLILVAEPLLSLSTTTEGWALAEHQVFVCSPVNNECKVLQLPKQVLSVLTSRGAENDKYLPAEKTEGAACLEQSQNQ